MRNERLQRIIESLPPGWVGWVGWSAAEARKPGQYYPWIVIEETGNDRHRYIFHVVVEKGKNLYFNTLEEAIAYAELIE